MEESRFSRGDVISGVVLAALGLYIIAEARRWEYLGADGPGPGFFPLWYGVIMVVLALLLIGGNLLRRGAGKTARPVDWQGTGRALLMWSAFAVSIALLKVLGFFLSFSLLTLFVVAVMYRRPLRQALVIAAGGALGFYLLFPLALNVSLPVGVLGF
ncbi:MAG: tripartite tricarboxylate transporter TctB family protein [Burkholderiales bacterium]|nr:tripartite tricarboxylate transporter TctB family protein [Burkholderiales bacterium]